MRLICCEAFTSEFSELLSSSFSIRLRGFRRTLAKLRPMRYWSEIEEGLLLESRPRSLNRESICLIPRESMLMVDPIHPYC